jgi:hypothetical protein
LHEWIIICIFAGRKTINHPYYETKDLHSDFDILRDTGGGADSLRGHHADAQLKLKRTQIYLNHNEKEHRQQEINGN